MPKMLFLSQEGCDVERWERRRESDGVSAEKNSGWIEWRCVWPVSLWTVPSRAEGQEVARGSWEDTSAPLCVSIEPLSDSLFK